MSLSVSPERSVYTHSGALSDCWAGAAEEEPRATDISAAATPGSRLVTINRSKPVTLWRLRSSIGCTVFPGLVSFSGFDRFQAIAALVNGLDAESVLRVYTQPTA